MTTGGLVLPCLPLSTPEWVRGYSWRKNYLSSCWSFLTYKEMKGLWCLWQVCINQPACHWVILWCPTSQPEFWLQHICCVPMWHTDYNRSTNRSINYSHSTYVCKSTPIQNQFVLFQPLHQHQTLMYNLRNVVMAAAHILACVYVIIESLLWKVFIKLWVVTTSTDIKFYLG